jgi:hypothetical protein
MNNDDSLLRLQDFVWWVRKRRSLQQDAWVDEQTLEYVTQGVERFLEGKKNPWPKRQGNKSKRDIMWKCYWLTQFAERDSAHLPQHSEEGGAFEIVGQRLNLSAKTVESHTCKAKTLVNTREGVQEFQEWLTKYKDNGLRYLLFPKDHPSAIAESERRDAAGVGRRKRRKIVVSEQIHPK